MSLALPGSMSIQSPLFLAQKAMVRSAAIDLPPPLGPHRYTVERGAAGEPVAAQPKQGRRIHAW